MLSRLLKAESENQDCEMEEETNILIRNVSKSERYI